jgi:hypothetical protein
VGTDLEQASKGVAFSSTFLHALVERVRGCPPDLAGTRGSGSLFDGAAGVAFFLLEAARLQHVDSLDLAESWCRAAESWSHRTPRDGSPAPEQRWGLMHGLGGVAYARVLVSSARRDARGVSRGIDMLASACAQIRHRGDCTSLFDGAAGLFAAVQQLNDRLEVAEAGELQPLRDSVWPPLADTLCIPIAGRGSAALDLAHGIAGELLVAAAHCGRTDFVRARARELARLGTRDAGTIRWPALAGGFPEQAPQALSTGMSGHAYLWTALARPGGEEEQRIAQLAANAMRLLGPATDASLGSGLAGQALVHERMGRDWVSPIHRRVSYARLRRALEMSRSAPSDAGALSLWQGTLGVGLVALLRNAGEVHIPCLEGAGVPEPSRVITSRFA